MSHKHGEAHLFIIALRFTYAYKGTLASVLPTIDDISCQKREDAIAFKMKDSPYRF